MQTDTIENSIETPEPLPAATPKLVAGILPRAFSTAKAGNAASDYEDAWVVGSDCLAIADGATESSFARLWAQSLAEGFVTLPSALFPLHTERPDAFRERLQAWTQPLQHAWHGAVPWATLPWFAEDKARSGAFATLLAFQTKAEGGVLPFGWTPRMKDEANSDSSFILHPSSFQVFAIGDSCLFQIRDGQVKTAFPLDHSSQFDSRPVLLSSNPIHNKRVWEEIAIAEGTFQPGDILLFATDALARWFLAECEAGTMPWHALCELKTQEAFEALVARLRHDHVMRNDDVTLVIVDASSVPPMPQPAAETAAIQPEPLQSLKPPEESDRPHALFAGTPSETTQATGELAASDKPTLAAPGRLDEASAMETTGESSA